MMKKLIAAATLACLTFSGMALEIQDLHLPMTRSEADKNLSKDYNYEVLEDASVRRTWNLANCSVSVDFDVATDNAVSIVVTYDKPVPRKAAMEDADAMSGETAAKWQKTKPEAVVKVGVASGARLRILEDKSMMFMEVDKKDKCSRIVYFAKAPKSNRSDLSAVTGEHRTAMGSTSGNSNIKALLQDEANRQATPLASDAAAAAASTPTGAKPVKSGGRKPASARKPGGPKTMKKVTVVTEVIDDGEGESSGPKENLLDVIREEATPAHYAIAGIVLLVLLFVICGGISAKRAKSKQKDRFAQLLSQQSKK